MNIALIFSLLHCVLQSCVSEGPRSVKEAHIPTEWPQEGAITFKNYSMRYRDNTPIVLNNLHIKIKPGEKLGIVGRTGSGEREHIMFYSKLNFMFLNVKINFL